jgi:CubicO group peptidase (beta-lactamase class C family)
MSGAVKGYVEPGFGSVADAFNRNLDSGEVGAGFALYVHGRKAVDIFGGHFDAARNRPYDLDSLQLVFSVTKGATSVCANLLIDRGLIDPDAPVVTYWPEFGQAGKADIPVRWLLCHKGGLPVIDRNLTLEEVLAWGPVVEALEVQEPLWEPGTAYSYHGLTFGWLIGEIVRRVDGRSLGQFFQDEVAKPLNLDFWIGLPSEQEPRVSPQIPMVLTPEMEAMMRANMDPSSTRARMAGLNGIFEIPATFNLEAVHAAELPAANGITNARSLARMYAGLISPVDGGPSTSLLGVEQIDRARQLQSDVPEWSQDTNTPAMGFIFGLGFNLSSTATPFGGSRAFGHFGAGGSVGFADPENEIAVGYVTNQMMASSGGDPRARELITASYQAAGAVAEVI